VQHMEMRGLRIKAGGLQIKTGGIFNIKKGLN
jgi:hypothetical protein